MADLIDTMWATTPPERQIEWQGRGRLAAAAPAKINLNLLVGPARQDGYHPLDSLVAKVSLHDVLELQARNDGRIALDCRGFDCGPMKENLAFRAAALLAEGREVPGADILLRKAIPPGVGLGSGSSDAAAALVALNELWQLGLSGDDLHGLACRAGSDVALFGGPACCRMTGRGESLQPVAIRPFFVALVLPGFQCSTPEVYRAYDRSPSPVGQQIDTALLANQPPSVWRDKLINDLAEPARAICPQLAELWDRLGAHANVPIHMTGSGSGLFALCDTAAEAQAFRANLPADLQSMCVLATGNPW